MTGTSGLPPQSLFVDVLQSIRAGDFLAVLQNGRALSVLKGKAAEENVDSVECLQASVMLAETYDQTSQYAEAERYLSFDRQAVDALNRLKEMTAARMMGDADEEDSERETARRSLRALAFFCLQHAIALHRRTMDASSDLKKAILLAQEAQQCLERLSNAGYNFNGTRSMFQYWMGRFELLNRNWEGARECFQRSMRHEHDNLRHHLGRHAEGLHGIQGGPDECAICSRKIAYTNYLLASNMAFGLALVEMEEGTVEKALTLLRPAMIMLDGSTRDDYRKGYVRLLIGRAERVRAGAQAPRLQRAMELLEEAKSLFTRDSRNNAAHHFYAARALHQLCIASLFMARDPDLPLEEKVTALLNAVRYLLQSFEQFHQERKAKESEKYIDHRLEVRLDLTKTRLLGEVLKACATWPGETAQDKLQAWLHRLPSIASFSAVWQKHGRESAASKTDEEIIDDLASELMETMLEAELKDAKLFDDEAGRSYVLLAQAEVIAVVTRFGGLMIGSERSKRFLWRLGAIREGLPDSKFGKKLFPQVWKRDALAAAIGRVKGLLERRNLKVRAAAEVALAHLLFLATENGGTEARKQLLQGWEPIKKRVENQILHDSVSELLTALTPVPSVCVIPLEDANGPCTWDQMLDMFRRQVLEKLRAEGLSEAGISTRLDMAQNTLRGWDK